MTPENSPVFASAGLRHLHPPRLARSGVLPGIPEPVSRAVLAASPPSPGRVRGKPLFPVRGVCTVIDADEDGVLRLIEEGKLLYAFNIALHPGRWKELRILPACVADFMQGRECALELYQALAMIVPTDGPELTCLQVTHALNCCRNLFFCLVRAGALSPCSGWKTGPQGRARVTRASLEEFLKARRWP